ncbi:MAG: sugar-binding domain-containing protein [Lachnospiraceae bacterium]|nr:sugar-binding domain-containing protein [Lachnospiraceae bacterium]
MENERFMFRVLEMYYTDELSQAEIAKKMRVSRATISRTILRAKQEGYVTISIHHPENTQHHLEKQLETKYGMQEVVIASPEKGKTVREQVNQEVTAYLLRVLKSGMTLGITWGLTLGSFIESLKRDTRMRNVNLKDVKVVPFIGTANLIEFDIFMQRNHANLYALELAEILKGIGYQLPAPMYVSNKKAKEVLESDALISQVLQQAACADIGFLPIGPVTEQSSFVKSGVLSIESMHQMKEEGAVGEVIGNFFTEDGRFLENEMSERMIGISREQLVHVPLKVGIAYGKDRVPAIKGALNSHIINVLITDSTTAKNLL